MNTVLAVTRELDTVRALRRDLRKHGCRVERVDNGQIALTRTRHKRPDLILLDLDLHGEDGLAVCQRLRQASAAPILVLATCLEQAERAIGQEVDADDFVVKPADPYQMTTRIQTLLRWAKRRNAARSALVRAGDLELNMAHHQAMIAGECVDLTRTELAMLAALAAEPGRALKRSQLKQALNSPRCHSERTVDSHIKNLRAKIEPDPRHPCYVITVYGVGYKLKVNPENVETQPTHLGLTERG